MEASERSGSAKEALTEALKRLDVALQLLEAAEADVEELKAKLARMEHDSDQLDQPLP